MHKAAFFGYSVIIGLAGALTGTYVGQILALLTSRTFGEAQGFIIYSIMGGMIIYFGFVPLENKLHQRLFCETKARIPIKSLSITRAPFSFFFLVGCFIGYRLAHS